MGGVTDAPTGSKFFQLHAVFVENSAKSYVGAPWRVGAPPTGNPGSAPEFNEMSISISKFLFITGRKRSCGKVMFLHLSVSHSVHNGGRGSLSGDVPDRDPSG